MTGPTATVDVAPPAGVHELGPYDVTLYPDHVTGDRGAYPLAAAELVDELTAEGVEARPWHDLDHSDWTGERDPILLTFVLGVASSAAWDAVKRVLRRRAGGRVKVIAGFKQGDDVRWVEAEGDAEAVAAALDRITPWQPPSS